MADGAAPASAYDWPASLADGPVVEPGSLAREGDACASCKLPVADAAETEGGQRVHRDGCPVDEPRLRLVRGGKAGAS